MQADTSRGIALKPFQWTGPYADYRSQQKAPHDWRLCAEVRGAWLGPNERLILRTSEVVGYETGFLYDDHFPPSEPEGRGKNYQHIPFEWKANGDKELSADCHVLGKGTFSLRLRALNDFVEIEMTARNELQTTMENLDWAFCAVAFEAPSIADPAQTRTYLFDGERLRPLGELGGPGIVLHKVAGAGGFIPVGHRALRVGSVEAKAPIVIIEGADGRRSVGLGFERADSIYGDAKGNKCFHADPYFGSLKPNEERKLRGRLYLMEGNAQGVLQRFLRDFPESSSHA
jgi:hypothetical protein